MDILIEQIIAKASPEGNDFEVKIGSSAVSCTSFSIEEGNDLLEIRYDGKKKPGWRFVLKEWYINWTSKINGKIYYCVIRGNNESEDFFAELLSALSNEVVVWDDDMVTFDMSVFKSKVMLRSKNYEKDFIRGVAGRL